MKCFVPEISWHNRDPVYSVDFQPKQGENEDFYRLASGGADCHVVIWHVTLTPNDDENRFASFECAADLQRHQKCVNCVRFAPNSQYLASGDDDGHVIVWKMREDVDPPELSGGGVGDTDKDKESWIPWKVLRGHLQDVYDLAWSPDSHFLASGSIDNTALIWDVEKRKNLGLLGEHKGFVQGVAWDPKGKYVATLSTDRNLRVFESTKRRQIARCFKGKLPAVLIKDKEEDKDKTTKLFHNDTLKTFFRRLTFSPHGELLLTPCGVLENGDKNHDVSFIFTRGSYAKPALNIPSPGLYTVAIRCCPVVYKLRGNSPSLFTLPYRIVYTIATRNSLVLHDTEQKPPFGYVGNIHYTGITDVTWSPDGRLVIASSSEGFCSVIAFDEGEIGEKFVINNDKTENIENETTPTLTSPDKIQPETEINTVNGNKILEKPVDLVFDNKMDVDNETASTKMETEKMTPEKKKDDFIFATPTKASADDDEFTDSSQCSDLSILVVGDEEELISKEEQARRLMSPYRSSPVAGSPRRTPQRSPMGSPITPKSGRRVNLITLSSPKSKRKL